MAFSPIRPEPRIPIRSTSRPARSVWAPWRRCSPPSRPLRRRPFPDTRQQPVRRPRWRRRTRRGQRLGGHRRPGDPGSATSWDRRLQPPIPRPGGPRYADPAVEGEFEAAGWHVLEAKYGWRLASRVRVPGGDACASGSTPWTTRTTSPCSGSTADDLRTGPRWGARPRTAFAPASTSRTWRHWSPTWAGTTSRAARRLRPRRRGDRAADRRVRLHGQGLGTAHRGQPEITPHFSAASRSTSSGQAPRAHLATEWDRLAPTSPSRPAGRPATRAPRPATPTERADVTAPLASGRASPSRISTQEAFGRILVDLSRDKDLAPYLVTTAPDVATSTNLAGFINRTGVFSPLDRPPWGDDPLLKWTESPTGQHIELGISEMNLFLLLGQLGLAWDLSDQPLLPIGTVYDPFVLRGLDAFIYSVYSGARFIVAGTPSGVTLAPEGGAHQSTITPSVGLELPNTTLIEPAYGTALDGCFATPGAYRYRRSNRTSGRRPQRQRSWRLLLPPHHPTARPTAVRAGAQPCG